MNTVLKHEISPEVAALMRPPEVTMKLKRLGSAHQTRLSFMRALLRRLKRENWEFERSAWEIDEKGVGHAVYAARGPRHTYSLVAFAHDLPAEQRSDRVIATAWDATFCLFDGEPDAADIERLRKNVPFQEAGRVSDRELSLSRANRSVRLWEYVVEKLAAGEQPDSEKIRQVGYLLRTTAVYGSGKFGAADRYKIEQRELAGGPFRIEMLSVYLTRAFSLDLVEHMASVSGGDAAVTLQPALRRQFGVGNSTGLGMAPFLINHPALLHNWVSAREEALARVRALPSADSESSKAFLQFVQRAVLNVEDWHSAHPRQLEKIADLKNDLSHLSHYLERADVLKIEMPWDHLWRWAESSLSTEGQEQLASLMIEPHGELVDELTRLMDADEYGVFRINGSQTVGELKQLIEKNYDWALSVDYSQKNSSARFWYVSEEKLEPRLGERFSEEGVEYEQPLCTGRDVSNLFAVLKSQDAKSELADFLLVHPEHRHAIRRIQLQSHQQYSEIQDNLISAKVLPIDLLRCKLSFFGATHFDPRSDRWVRICMFQNAPFPNELKDAAADDWAYPPLESTSC